MRGSREALLAFVVSLIAAGPAIAQRPADRGPTPGLGWGPGGSKGISVPGPVAGVGLPVLAFAGGYIWLARRRRSKARRSQE